MFQGAASADAPCGYWLVGSDGGSHTFRTAAFPVPPARSNFCVPSSASRGDPGDGTSGYPLVGSDGGIFSFDTGFYGSIPGIGLNPAGSGLPHSLNAPIVATVHSVTGQGYFLVAPDGGVFAFGDATFAGSCSGIGGCAGSAVAVVPEVTGLGYWVVTDTGNVYAFGDAGFYGSSGPQSTPITSAAATEPTGAGYYILHAAGQVFAYGPATYFGSLPAGATTSSDSAAAIFVTDDHVGYWIVTAQGKVYPFGDAPFEGTCPAPCSTGQSSRRRALDSRQHWPNALQARERFRLSSKCTGNMSKW